MKIQMTRAVAAVATTVWTLSAVVPASAQYQGPYAQGQQYNDPYQNNRNGQNDRDYRNDRDYQNDRNYQNGRDYQNGRNETRRDAFDPPRDRSRAWQRRYSQVYTSNDDNYYQN